MKQLQDFRYIYFLGIGGIGMSALARWFRVNGYEVAGYDKTPTPLTDELQAEGMAIHFVEDVAQIPIACRENPNQTLVIYTPAVPQTHAEYIYLTEHGFLLQKRSQVLGLLADRMTTVAVAGTHGKTTTSSMIAHILRHSGINCAAFLGGITANYGTNFLLNEPSDDLQSVICVVEADEFDRSFLTLHPQVAVVTATDADHLDIYGAHEAVLESFAQFVSQIRPGAWGGKPERNGVLILKDGLTLAEHTTADVQTYAIDRGRYHAQNLRIGNGVFRFDMVYPNGMIAGIELMVPGFHNVENALAAAAAARVVGVSDEAIRIALNTYKGVKRRFEYWLKTPTAILIDDYAHHPAEVEAFLSSVKALYPDRPLTVLFQPHLFSRTRDFAEGFANSLSLADAVWLLDIYPARELPIEGITSEIIFRHIRAKQTYLVSKEEAVALAADTKPPLLVTVGAGDIDRLLPTLKAALTNH